MSKVLSIILLFFILFSFSCNGIFQPDNNLALDLYEQSSLKPFIGIWKGEVSVKGKTSVYLVIESTGLFMVIDENLNRIGRGRLIVNSHKETVTVTSKENNIIDLVINYSLNDTFLTLDDSLGHKGEFSSIAVSPVIKDYYLNVALRCQLEPADDEIITRAHLEEITDIINIRNSGTSDIKGIDQCPNLIMFSSCNTRISDLSPLSGLTNLQSVILKNNNIKDLSPLENLDLSTLNLEGNGINFIDDGGQGTKNLSVINKLLDAGCIIRWKKGNIVE